MSADLDPTLRQGGTTPWRERLPLPAREQMDDGQRAAAQALVDGPRKGVFGPFLPLLRTPVLLDRVAALGEALRFKGTLQARVRELAICTAARHVGNQFEWHMHAPLAVQAGVDGAAIDLLRQGARPQPLADDEALAHELCDELLRTHGVSDPTYARAVERFGEAAVVELVTLVGYFVMVSWLMNVAHTPAQKPAGAALPSWPA